MGREIADYIDLCALGVITLFVIFVGIPIILISFPLFALGWCVDYFWN